MKSMDCTDIKALLSGLIDDEVDASTRHDAERHLAECATCRDLLSEAEAIDQGVSAELETSFGFDALPSRFEGAVLAATVYADGSRGALNRWINWTGWLAAAACLALAAFIAMTDRRPAPPSNLVARTPSAPVVTPTVQPAVYGIGHELRSRVLENSPVGAGAKAPARADDAPAVPMSMDDDSGWRTGPTIAELMAASVIAPEDAEILYTASILLDIIANADPESAVETITSAERVRETAEYDDLLLRLSKTRRRLAPVDRATVFAAESILLRVVRGPVSVDDLQLLRETVVNMNLAERLHSISDRSTSSPSV